MPLAIAKLPRTGDGIPIPFINLVYENGEADLRIIDQRKIEQCVTRKRCGICGLVLGREIVFIGGPMCFENHFFSDPAMHEECARYASKVCPYLALQNSHHSRTEEPRYIEPGLVFAINPLAPPAGEKRPDKMMLYFTHGFRLVLKIGGTRLIQAYKPHKVEWF